MKGVIGKQISCINWGTCTCNYCVCVCVCVCVCEHKCQQSSRQGSNSRVREETNYMSSQTTFGSEYSYTGCLIKYSHMHTQRTCVYTFKPGFKSQVLHPQLLRMENCQILSLGDI